MSFLADYSCSTSILLPSIISEATWSVGIYMYFISGESGQRLALSGVTAWQLVTLKYTDYGALVTRHTLMTPPPSKIRKGCSWTLRLMSTTRCSPRMKQLYLFHS
jgi:hypothetical protein